jgi:glycosyltransferase involved in cell wall biosynthesis
MLHVREDNTPHAPRDPRLESALAWTQKRGLQRITLAIPFHIPAQDVNWVISHDAVVSLILNQDADEQPEEHAARTGFFDRSNYTWKLPPELAPQILYLGAQHEVTARMLRALIQRRVERVAFLADGAWRNYSLLPMAAGKGYAKIAVVLRSAYARISPSHTQSPCNILVRTVATFFPEWPYQQLIAPLPKSSASRSDPVPDRVLIACPTLTAGGAERQIVTALHGLRARGVRDIHLYVSNLYESPGNDFFLLYALQAGVQVNHLNRPSARPEKYADWWTRLPRHVARRLRKLPDELAFEIAALYLEITRLRPSVVHTWLDHSNITGGLAALLAGTPRVVLSGRNVSPRHFPYILKPYMHPAYRTMASRSEVVFLNNSVAGAKDYASWLGISLSRFRIIYNGLHLDRLNRASPVAVKAFREENNVPPSAPLIGGMFRLSEEKRPQLWLDAVRAVLAARSDAYALLFGAGPLHAPLTQEILREGLDGRVRILPPTLHNVIPLSAFDLLLLTSRWEGTPNVALEAQALGTPVVVTGGGGTREAILPGATGLFVESEDASSLASAVLILLEQAQRRVAMGAAGREFIRDRFAAERMVADILTYYRSA